MAARSEIRPIVVVVAVAVGAMLAAGVGTFAGRWPLEATASIGVLAALFLAAVGLQALAAALLRRRDRGDVGR